VGKKLRLAFFQFFPRIGDRKYNEEFVVNYMLENSIETDGLEIVVFPELALTGYDLSREKFKALAKEFSTDNYSEFIKAIAHVEKKRGGRRLWVVGDARKGACDSDESSCVYNSVVLLSSDGVVGYYDKLHLFFKEKERFIRGDKLGVFEFDGVKFGTLICFDWIFPELSRLLVLNGAKILLFSANLVLPYAQNAVWTRAVENRSFVVLANRIGRENNYTFTGRSRIVSPRGLVLAEVDADSTSYISVEVDLGETSSWITEKNNVFEDRHSLLKFKEEL